MKHGTMSLRDRAAAWAFAPVLGGGPAGGGRPGVFLGARPLQGMLPPWTRSRSSMSPPPTRIWSGSSGGERLGQALGELRGGLAGALSGHPL